MATSLLFQFHVDAVVAKWVREKGEITVGMQSMADIHLPCEACSETLMYKGEVHPRDLVQDKHIADVLDMDIEAALAYFGAMGDKLSDKIVAPKFSPCSILVWAI